MMATLLGPRITVKQSTIVQVQTYIVSPVTWKVTGLWSVKICRIHHFNLLKLVRVKVTHQCIKNQKSQTRKKIPDFITG